MKSRIFIYVLALLAMSSNTLFSSCNNGDTTPPVITLNAPEEGEVYTIGQDMHFDMELFDNDTLGSYKVVVHNAFDGHTHNRAENEGTVPFAYENTWDVSGLKNTHIHHHEIIIPENATPGNYHFMVYCYDASHNEAYVARNIVIINGEEQ